MKKYYIYVKTSPFGLKYLGKTCKDPCKYMGSGQIWKKHLKKHNLTYNDVKTEVLFETDDVIKLIEFGINISQELDIVNSKEWANLIPERGDGGDTSKYIDYNRQSFHLKSRADHLNGVGLSETERNKLFKERSSKIDYHNPERLEKIKNNTDWSKLVSNRDIDYSKFLPTLHNNNKKKILQLNLDGSILKEFDSSEDAAKELNVKANTIRSWIGNKRIGLNSKWCFKKDYEDRSK
jgi:hypothetical protein